MPVGVNDNEGFQLDGKVLGKPYLSQDMGKGIKNQMNAFDQLTVYLLLLRLRITIFLKQKFLFRKPGYYKQLISP
jgi:hypothetical protein